MATTRLSLVAFAGLVAASIAAFFVTQHLKVTTPLIAGGAGAPRPVPAVIDPVHPVQCGAVRTGSTTISFYLQHRSDDVIVSVVNADDDAVVRTVADGRHMRKGVRIPDGVFHWNGRLADGTVAPDGNYYFRVTLIHQNRTIDLTGVPVKVKTTAPHPVITSVQPTEIAPGTQVTIHYAGNEHRGGTIVLYRLDLPGGPRQIKAFLTPWKGNTAVWDGTVAQQQPAPAGTYLLALQVSDAACNTGRYPALIPPAAGSAAASAANDVVTVR
ncbi:MAG TPA: FlgD immunoglobulin-like domain containing protein [Solirubrobacteraceae bacterium]|nr:FlgD immunoglobulin-like domain containing protein [Solirubrobacteraceae bacterium]